MSSIDQLYQQLILDHARMRHGYQGNLEKVSAQSFQVNPTCGDELCVKVLLESAKDRLTLDAIDAVSLENNAAGNSPDKYADSDDLIIRDFSWDGQGCSISQASISMLHDLVVGQKISHFNKIIEIFHQLMDNRGNPLEDQNKEEELGDAIALMGTAKFPARIKCALLGWMALRDATAKAVAQEIADGGQKVSSTVSADHC